MKKVYLLVASLVLTNLFLAGQNLVPNGSFENAQCPSNLPLSYTSDWQAARSTPDYFNACAVDWQGNVPVNRSGYQLAAEGNAYIGLLTYRLFNVVSEPEAVIVQLTNPLIKGQNYYVSFKLSLTLGSDGRMANNNIGIQFSTTQYSLQNPISFNNRCHICTDHIVTDSLNWTIVKGVFVADSAYSYLLLGSFFENQYTNAIGYGNNYVNAYYYFDDVRLSTDSNYAFQTVGINGYIRNGSYFNVYPNPTTDYFVINKDINESYNLTVYNAIGQKLLHEERITENDKIINCKNYNTNFFIVKISVDNHLFYHKILKQ